MISIHQLQPKMSQPGRFYYLMGYLKQRPLLFYSAYGSVAMMMGAGVEYLYVQTGYYAGVRKELERQGKLEEAIAYDLKKYLMVKEKLEEGKN